ncbi:MAG: hypothetical protein OEU26_08385 [Candidatus Tectomicrobia bacterium]|nr:hypothetical protein [Candidatus Tectomicrobia bacterium]
MRIFRKFLAIILPILGGILLLYSAVVEPTIQRQFLILGIGFIVILVGAWRLFHGLLPNERRFFKLRGEVDAFVKLVRHLNTESYQLKQNASLHRSQVIQDLQNEMHAAVDRMVEVAGVPSGSEPSVALDTQQEYDQAAAL